MTSHGHGRGKKCVSTTINEETLAELERRARAGGWKSVTAYMRAVIELHAQQRQAIARSVNVYEMPEPEPEQEQPDKQKRRPTK